MDADYVPYGPVYITNGPHAGRIGYYDNDETEFPDDIDWDAVDDEDGVPGQEMAVVYFGNFFLNSPAAIMQPV